MILIELFRNYKGRNIEHILLGVVKQLDFFFYKIIYLFETSINKYINKNRREQ